MRGQAPYPEPIQRPQPLCVEVPSVVMAIMRHGTVRKRVHAASLVYSHAAFASNKSKIDEPHLEGSSGALFPALMLSQDVGCA